MHFVIQRDFLVLALRNLQKRFLRSFLTALGVIIGVAALISLLLVGLGLDYTIKEQFEKIGTNRIYVVMKGGGLLSLKEGLTEKDVHTLERVHGFSYVTPYLIQPTRVEFKKEAKTLTVIGYPADDARQRFEGHDITLHEGRYFEEGERGAANIGYRVAYDHFDEDILVNNQLLINGKRVRVVGIFDSIGNAQDDSNIYVPLEEARALFDKPDTVSAIEILLMNGVNLQQTVQRAERLLESQREDDDFDILTPDQVIGQLQEITLIVNSVLLAIAAVSLLVGSLGIMNSMYTAVLERTKEIGIMKSLGATNAMIQSLFLFEAGAIGIVGGFFGILIGVGIALLVEYIAGASGVFALHIPISWPLLVAGLIFGFVIGIVSGYLPAKRASQLLPVIALQKVR